MLKLTADFEDKNTKKPTRWLQKEHLQESDVCFLITAEECLRSLMLASGGMLRGNTKVPGFDSTGYAWKNEHAWVD